MSRLLRTLVIPVAAISLVAPTFSQSIEPVDEAAVEVIKKHGLDNSQVMDVLHWLTDVHGPRLTGSPGLDNASGWAVSKLEEWGLANVQLEPWGPFGRGWSLHGFTIHARGSASFPVLGYPKAWSPPTEGLVRGEVVIFDAESEEQFAEFEGKLAGKIVLVESARDLEEPFEPLATRRDAEDLLKLANYAQGDEQPFRYSPEAMRRLRVRQQRVRFVYGEQPLAIIDRSYRGDYGTVFVSQASVPSPPDASWFSRPSPWDLDAPPVIPQITIATEHFNRLHRLVSKGHPVELEFSIDAEYHDSDPMEYNVIAELPGSDSEIGNQVVMVGAHLDSWHAGTGATDNGAGSAVMMEVMRILKESYAELERSPRRTIRMGLWTGEEQGLHGSRAYVADHFATIPGWGEPPTVIKPEHAEFSAYYNLDNGTGKIRGIYSQGNTWAEPIFKSWLKPFADMDASTVTTSNTGGTDHLAFDAAGLPGFQFIQDPMAYRTRTHHSNMDVFDHASEEDLKQAATLIASFVYHTAERDALLPRKPLKMAETESEAVTSGTK